jgi:hypothetical protein
VGYRVKSQRGTQFRIWATNVLKEYLIKGYTINEKRLREDRAKLKEFQKTVSLFLWFLNENGILYHEDGSKRLADNALVAFLIDCGKPSRRKRHYGQSNCKLNKSK